MISAHPRVMLSTLRQRALFAGKSARYMSTSYEFKLNVPFEAHCTLCRLVS